MFIVLLNFSTNRERAGELMDAHNAWLKRGFDDGVLLLAGSQLPGPGGMLLARAESRAALETRVGGDPLVAEEVVSAEIIEVAPAMTDERLRFLLG